MIIFNADEVELAIEPYLPFLRKITIEAFKDYQDVRGIKNIPYNPLTMALLIRDYFKDRLTKLEFVDGDKIKIVSKNNTFFLYIGEYPITFNKLRQDKSKCKYIDDVNMNIAYNFNQLTLLVNSSAIGKKIISEEIPLTFGYMLNPIRTEIIGCYLTYQVGKKVEWYKKVEFEQPIIITSVPNDEPKKARITIK